MKTLGLGLLAILGLVAPVFGGGLPHNVTGSATYANATVPHGSPELTFNAYIIIPDRSNEVLNQNSPGCGTLYDAGPPEVCYWWVQCANFPTPWQDGEVLQVDFYGDGTNNPPTFRPESSSVVVVLDESVPYQDVGEIEIPVELSAFEAVGGEEEVVLRWATVSETNNLGFFLHRGTSSTGPWETVNKELIPGAGMSGTGRQYVYRDRNLAPLEYWYELEDVSSVGTSNRHGPISVVVSPVSKLVVTAANVVGDQLHLGFSVPRAGKVKGAMYNVAGREAKVLFDQRFEPGSHHIICDLEGVASGLYLCKIHQEGFEEASVRLPITR